MKHAIMLAIALSWACTEEFVAKNIDALEDPTEDPAEDPTEETQDSTGEGPEAVDDPDPPEGEVPCTVFYRDEDSDSYGGQTEACLPELVEGYVENSDDCCDTNEHAHPGVTAFYEYTFSCDGEDGGFDWDCSGDIERAFDVPNHAVIDCGSGGCSGEGWSPRYPECGESSSYGHCVLDGAYCRLDPTWSGIMRCH